MASSVRLMALTSGLALTAACNSAPPPVASGPTERFCYASSDGRRVRSTMVRTPEQGGGERLVGVTELDDGRAGRLRQDVVLDQTGALGRAEARLDAVGGRPAKHVVMDPVAGSVDVTTAAFHVHWTVPTDLPWVWAPLLTVSSAGGPIATPLDARVVWRAAAEGRTVRLLDLGVLADYGVTADQVAVSDASGGTVVLGDDAVDMEGDGMPKRLHLMALNSEVEPVGAGGTSGTLVAAARCIPANGFAAQ